MEVDSFKVTSQGHHGMYPISGCSQWTQILHREDRLRGGRGATENRSQSRGCREPGRAQTGRPSGLWQDLQALAVQGDRGAGELGRDLDSG